jgi:DNA-binding transcriptional MerR regulator
MEAPSQDARGGKLRMRDLTAMTGLDRQTIHFYMKAGLLPEGDKTGRNKALYDREHVERIELIRKLQKEQFLPLKAIRAVLDGDEAAFEPAQRRLLLDVKAMLRARGFGAVSLGAHGASSAAEEAERIPVLKLLEQHGLPKVDFDEMVELGLLHVEKVRGADGKAVPSIRRRDAFRIELLGAIRQAGLTRELGFAAADLLIYEEAIERLFVRERELVMSRIQHLDPGVIARIFERTLPLVGELLHRLHTARAERFFESLGADEEEVPAPKRTPNSPTRPRRKRDA